MQKVKINKLDLKYAKIMLNGFNHSKQYNELYIKQYWLQVDLTIVALILGYSIFIDIQSQMQQIVDNQIINYTINAIKECERTPEFIRVVNHIFFFLIIINFNTNYFLIFI